MTATTRSLRLFSQTLHSDVPLRPHFLPGGPVPDLVFGVGDARRLGAGASEDEVVLNFTRPSRLDFVLTSDRIWCTPHACSDEDVEIAFLGQVMAVWMERRGTLMLHAGAVVMGGQGVGFMGPNGSGKSTLVSCLVRQGFPLLTDDVMAVAREGGGYWVRPSYPSMRMWPQTARALGLDVEPLPRVHRSVEKRLVPVGTGRFGSFHDALAPLARIYVLSGRLAGERARIEPVAAGEAVFRLASESFVGRRLHRLGLGRKRFAAIAELARHVPLRRLAVPEGLEQVGAVESAIAADLAGGAGLPTAVDLRSGAGP